MKLGQELIDEKVVAGARAVMAAAAALPTESSVEQELASAARAQERGYFLPDEDVLVRLRYSQYLTVRAALLETIADLSVAAGRGSAQWQEKLPVFVTAFAAACLLMRVTRFIVDQAAERSVVWKKLDEADGPAGIPRKTFTSLYKSSSSGENAWRFIAAADFYFRNRGKIRLAAKDPVVGPVVELLLAEEMWIEHRRRDLLRRAVSYRWYSFLRRHRSAWKQVMFGLFKASGSAIAELRQPGIKPAGAPKRMTDEMRSMLLARVRPGDVFVTRHDDAMSNLFLPGFWPHAAFYLGEGDGSSVWGKSGGRWFLEAKKDGVLFREIAETLSVDSCVVLRPPLNDQERMEGLQRATSHAGKPYDFLFDFRTADCLACTEVVYRGLHGIGPIRFTLREVGGRLCLPAEEMISQALECGFEVVATAGLGGAKVLFGTAAEIAFHGSRQPV
ncbi:hypothetical protein JIN85_05455 [Luteolibacter pohnpeiensis]|uniref:Uncharacterized protein n=1 Tax=Luteolibacter pohnpeiensis TaxID=454153 RepID=A0A934S631_9BACT|nr:YiiX/YebB-like N1pC/P60 family cysteine hydrolase [Luteolibacter pohnpeiensis]MBK1881849.1 hypothetical protein [Luteolibacter pohnpeiensis]